MDQEGGRQVRTVGAVQLRRLKQSGDGDLGEHDSWLPRLAEGRTMVGIGWQQRDESGNDKAVRGVHGQISVGCAMGRKQMRGIPRPGSLSPVVISGPPRTTRLSGHVSLVMAGGDSTICALLPCLADPPARIGVGSKIDEVCQKPLLPLANAFRPRE